MPEHVIVEVRRGFEVVAEHAFVEGRELLVGRAEEADVRLDVREVSRRHAVLSLLPGGVAMRDLSRNGLVRGGRRIPDGGLLPYGEAVDIGPFTLVLGRPRGPASDLAEVKRRILDRLIEQLELEAIEHKADTLRPRVEAALARIARATELPPGTDLAALVSELANEALGLGPLEALLGDARVSEIMVVDARTIYVEKAGRLERSGSAFTSEKAVRATIERIIAPLGRRIDESSPMVDARLPDGSRVNAVIPPLAIRGPCITIRKFSARPLGMADLVGFHSLTAEMADLLGRAVEARANIVISGGTGSGKTTLLGALAAKIPADERIVTVEDAAELRLPQPHVVPLETRPPNAEGRGEVTIRDLVRNALRMRPDRIVVGECRGGEALDMLQAMNTGHDGSLTTVHANSPVEAISRLETLCLMAGIDLPSRAIREQIAQAIDLIVQQCRLPDGSRRITSITEVFRLEEDGTIAVNEIFRYARKSGANGGGAFLATGWLPTFLDADRDSAESLDASEGDE